MLKLTKRLLLLGRRSDMPFSSPLLSTTRTLAVRSQINTSRLRAERTGHTDRGPQCCVPRVSVCPRHSGCGAEDAAAGNTDGYRKK